MIIVTRISIIHICPNSVYLEEMRFAGPFSSILIISGHHFKGFDDGKNAS